MRVALGLLLALLAGGAGERGRPAAHDPRLRGPAGRHVGLRPLHRPSRGGVQRWRQLRVGAVRRRQLRAPVPRHRLPADHDRVPRTAGRRQPLRDRDHATGRRAALGRTAPPSIDVHAFDATGQPMAAVARRRAGEHVDAGRGHLARRLREHRVVSGRHDARLHRHRRHRLLPVPAARHRDHLRAVGHGDQRRGGVRLRRQPGPRDVRLQARRRAVRALREPEDVLRPRRRARTPSRW